VISREQYQELLSKEAAHWGAVRHDPRNPQLWHDERLFEIFFGREYRYFVNRICRTPSSVLELGCGEGSLALDLARRGVRVTALDLSAERINRARRRAAEMPIEPAPTFRVADLNTVVLPAQRFDSVVAHDALHHLYDLDHVLDQAQKALKKHGRLIVMDFIGMSRVRKLLAAALSAILPTMLPYGSKWQLRHRLGAFLTTESEKRKALEAGNVRALHSESPFEEISQRSIIEKIRSRFLISEYRSFCPFGYYLAPKLRLPHLVKYRVARFLKEVDDELTRLGVSGAYIFLEAENV
jgi:2-polyprenyl-3-methyl-5-hydroxy-6-metoxy-1,4-benzoquinol methylase